jgi:hypothetical protein
MVEVLLFKSFDGKAMYFESPGGICRGEKARGQIVWSSKH